MKRKLKLGKVTTLQRNRCKPAVPQTEKKEATEEKRLKEMKKLNKLSQHCSSLMKTCQAIVNPDDSKTDTPKTKGI